MVGTLPAAPAKARPKSSDHGITPVERAAFLTEIIASGDEFGLFLESLFGDEVSVAEFHTWVKLNCEEL